MTAATLEPTLRAVEPAARLVSERQLRRVLHAIRETGRPVGSNPALPYRVSRGDLRAADVDVPDDTPAIVVLLVDPDDRLIAGRPAAEQLRVYWRGLFQAAVMAAVDAKLVDGGLTVAVCAERLNRLGPAEAREIRFVLASDHVADPAADAADVYRLFAAVYLDRVSFAPDELEWLFPSLPDPRDVLAVLSEDVNAADLLARSRPAGAADPERPLSPVRLWIEPPSPAAAPPDLPPGEPGTLLGRALDAERKGNFVRAAILRSRAAVLLAGAAERQANAAARSAVGKLVDRLGTVFDWDEPTRREWRQALDPLLTPAMAGFWPRAARCLYELQKIPGELGREVFAVDLAESIRTLGRRPVKRPLPYARDVMLLMDLRRAHRQLLRAAVGEAERVRLDLLFRHEMHRAEHAIRHAQAPVITAALTDAGFVPGNRVEEVARDKAVAELLDRVCERGHLRFGDLRDAVARNQLKMPDLRGPVELVGGDPLLRADTRLAYALDGVYRRGEFYLRFLHRASSVFFGTAFGRPLTLFLVLPVVAALMTVIFAAELKEYAGKASRLASRLLAPKPAAAPAPAPAIPDVSEWMPDEILTDEERREWEELVRAMFTSNTSAKAAARAEPEAHHNIWDEIDWPTVAVLAVVVMMLINWPGFRRGAVALLRWVGAGLRLILHDLPLAVWQSPPVKAVRRSAAVRFVNRYLGGAVITTAVVVLVMWALGADVGRLLRAGGIVFVAVALVANTRLGWVAQERLAERVADWWRVVRVNMLPGLIAWIAGGFRWLANWFERRLYAVDELLRYRGGDSQGSLALKAAIGLVWFPFAYLARFAFYLLFEPQVNPIKHFPVVTVSHKVLLPMIPTVAEALKITKRTAFGIIFCIPGIFGFIAWELLANWRLYRANRADRLRPVMVGSHGESMRGLLRPGFHSGTVPKLFRKLRAAKPEQVARYRHELEHAAEAVHRFVERELVPLLKRSQDWGGARVEVEHVRFGCQRAVVELVCHELGRDPLVLAFENRNGRVEASVPRPGWFATLTGPRRDVFVAAVRGLFDMAAAELFEGAERSPPPRPTPLDPSGPLAELRGAYEWPKWVDRWESAKG